MGSSLHFAKFTNSLEAKLIFGFIFNEDEIYKKAKLALCRAFSKIDFESEEIPFTFTDYYEEEFGRNLKRRFISVKKHINPLELAKIKVYTNRLEKKFALGGLRRINIDPGYLNHAKLVLASTKDYYHRIYLNFGIFAEITLYFQDDEFKTLDWTYPDYKTGEYRQIFKQIRKIYVQGVKGK